MTRQAIIERTINAINQLPEDKAEENVLSNGIQKLSGQGQTFDFLNDDEEAYTVADLKEVYNG